MGSMCHGLFTRVPRDRDFPYTSDAVPLRVDVLCYDLSVTKANGSVPYPGGTIPGEGGKGEALQKQNYQSYIVENLF